MHILHGEDQVASRNELGRLVSEAKLADQEVVTLDGKSLDMTALTEAVEAPSLFSQDRLIVVERLLSRPTSKLRDQLVDYLAKNQAEPVVWWEAKALTPALVKQFKQTKVTNFKFDQILFTFLDGLSPWQARKSLALLESLLKQQPAEVIMAMVTRQVRKLLVLKGSGPEMLTKTDRVADWQIRKLQGQAKQFSLDQLYKWYEQILAYDYARKSGQTQLSVENQLRLWVCTLDRP
jgi:DNA polymerase III delta subunit